MENEIFLPIKGYEGLYEVSNLGNVKSLRMNRNLIQILKSTGYKQVGLSKNGNTKRTTVHLLVVGAFLNHFPSGNKILVNHINFNKTDNRLENLEVVPARVNANQKHLPSTSEYTGVCWHKREGKWRAQIYVNRKMKYLGSFNCEIEASNAYEKYLSNHLKSN